MKDSYFKLMEMANNYVAETKPSTQTPEQVASVLRPLTQSLNKEVGFVLILNTKNKVIKIITTSIGILDQTFFHPREIFREAILNNASRIILAHNHPSGDSHPSMADIAATEKVEKAGKIIGIEVLDHIIMGEKTEGCLVDHYSFRHEGLMPF